MNTTGDRKLDDLESICAKVDRQLLEKHILPENTDARLDLFRPLERAVAWVSDEPPLPDTPAGKVARSLWSKLHPSKADLDSLLDLAGSEVPLVRVAAVEAIAATLETNERWSDPAFSASARQVLQQASELETSPVISFQLRRLLGLLPKGARPKRRAALKIVSNPYLAGLPVSRRENFFGRQQVLEEIGRTLRVGGEVKSIVLYGARRTGKTSVLYRLRDGALGDSFLPVYLDMQALAGTTLPDFLRALLTETAAAVRDRAPELLDEIDPRIAGEIQFPILQKFFNSILARLGGVSVVLLMDEYEVLDQFLTDGNLGRQFQYLLDHEPRLFVVFAGSRKLEALKNPNFVFLLDISKDLRISFLKREETVALITESSAGRLDFDSTAVDRIVKLTGGHPFYTQLLCQIIFDQMDGNGRVESSQLEHAVRQFIENPPPHLILTWNGLSMEQKVVASAAAQEGVEFSHSPNSIVRVLRRDKYPMGMRPGEVEQEFAALAQIDWVKKDFGEGTYSFTMDLVRRWIKENHSVAALAEEYRDQVVSHVASFWRQKLGVLADLALLGALGLGVVLLTDFLKWSELLAWVFYGVVATLYFAVSIPSARSTPGLRLAHLRVVDTSARPIGHLLGTIYGLVLTARLMLLLVVSRGVVDRGYWWNVGFAVFLTLASVDNLMILFSKKHQGLYDKVMRTMIVSAKAIREE